MKYLFLLSALITIGVNADTANYSHTGVVLEQSSNSNEVLISGQKYYLDSETQINTVMPINEFGPIFQPNQLIGFNAIFGAGDIPVITEIWLLGSEQ